MMMSAAGNQSIMASKPERVRGRENETEETREKKSNIVPLSSHKYDDNNK
jgi:hypothetical protein